MENKSRVLHDRMNWDPTKEAIGQLSDEALASSLEAPHSSLPRCKYQRLRTHASTKNHSFATAISLVSTTQCRHSRDDRMGIASVAHGHCEELLWDLLQIIIDDSTRRLATP